MTTPSDKQRAEWLRLLEAEQARRTTKQAWEAAAGERAREQFLDQIIEMGERLVPGGEQDVAILDNLVEAQGNRDRIDAIRLEADMSMAAACALILTKDPETAVDLLEQCGRDAMRRAHT